MANFAELDENNIVIRCLVVHNDELLDKNGNESEQKGIDFCIAHWGGRWKQTSINGKIRVNMAIPGGIYDEEKDAFYSLEAPIKGFVFNEKTLKWTAPDTYPLDGFSYYWNEEIEDWVKD